MPTRLNIYGQSISTTKKRPCIAATTTNVALSGVTTPTIVDGVTISIGDRILVRQQNLSKDNGIYKLETSQLLSRDYDFNISNDLYAGIEVLVLSGLTYSGKTFYLTTTGNITIGSTPLTFDIFAGQNGSSGNSGTSGTSGSNAGITSYTNPADNRVITSVSASVINAEANLTFDGTVLTVTGTITETSSKHTKDNIITLENSLEIIKKLRGVQYNRKGTSLIEIGLIAEEVEDFLPQIVTKDYNGNPSSVSYGRLVALLVEAVKKQDEQIQNLTKRIEELEK